MNSKKDWPALDFFKMQDTIETLHQWIQIVGKIRLSAMPWQNHSWHCALYVTPNGFSTHSIPYKDRAFQIDFDFRAHQLLIICANSTRLKMELYPRTVADFYEELFNKLATLDIDVEIYAKPNEMEPAIPFSENTTNKYYNPDHANALWKAMLNADNIFNQFRSGFIGKCSPVHLFWGSFDLAVTRFSGNPAPPHPGGMPNMPLDVMQEAYSQEVSSAGFWAGSEDYPIPMFYAYAYPEAEDFAKQKVLPEQAFYSKEMGEFVLKYDDVRNSENPTQTLLDFLQTTYLAAANTANWDRARLERS